MMPVTKGIRWLAVAAVILTAAAALAYQYPPYEVYPYLGESTDNPPVNYMKVCDPGRTGEENASYVVLGISYPRTYQAVNGDYEGNLVIPAYIDGSDRFTADIDVVDGNPVISIRPQLSEAEKARRKYTIYGRKSLLSGDWVEIPAGSEKEYNFFKVSVELRE